MSKKKARNSSPLISDLIVQYVDIAKLKPDPKNPRIHDEEHVDEIADSINVTGMNVPILCDSNFVIIAGTGTYFACLKNGMTVVPVIVLKHLTEAKKVAFRIAHNKLCENGQWNPALLLENFEFLQSSEIDFDIEVTGFETPEIDVLSLGGKDAIKSAAKIAALEPELVDIPELPAQPVSKAGDIFTIGKHKVACGDARDKDLLKQLLGGHKIELGLTDPPYNISGANIGGRGKIPARNFIMGSGELSDGGYESLLEGSAANMASFSRPGAYNCFFTAYYAMHCMQNAFCRVYPTLTHMCIWSKTNGGMGKPWRNAWEGILVYRVKGGRTRDNVQLGRFGRNRTDVFVYPGVNVFRKGRMEELESHPTCKPILLLKDLILDVTPIGGVVFDGFLGSGSTVIAAHQAGRVGIGVELDPKYVDVAVQRISKEIGAPIFHQSGLTFEELAARREGEQ